MFHPWMPAEGIVVHIYGNVTVSQPVTGWTAALSLRALPKPQKSILNKYSIICGNHS